MGAVNLRSASYTENDLSEYLVIIRPDSRLYEKIREEMEAFHHNFEKAIPAETLPHITIASFTAKESMEETIIRWIQRVCSRQQSFRVTFNNYSGVPPHSIYLRIQNEKPFQQLAKDLKVIDSYVSSCSCPPVNLFSRPVLNILQSLPEAVYHKTLAQYAQRSFHDSFIVNELLLVKRPNAYEPVKAINVFGLPPANDLAN